ncbi:alpha-galactosidase [Trichococcus patagoniensis]|uniref:Alpha-galactosidase n=1 Tax=Trichococcus patagoniensis TaxID=382641 RepID=A0A2T5IFW7_9LACT|nr:alpha-galactosidase [Trichococcus patagoniensis]PTQ82713.1 alpha-galactosidase [Trichococcus patagoniensis]
MIQIKFNKQDNTFHLTNGRISYCFGVEKERYLMHQYFGKGVKEYRGSNQAFMYDRGFCSNPIPTDRTFSLDALPQEFPDMNQGDFRNPAYVIQTGDGKRVSRFYYKSHEILPGKPSMEDLPAIYAEENSEAETLCIILADEVMEAEIHLYYTVFEDYDVICRHTEIVNLGKQELYVERLMSMSIDLPKADYDVLTLCGSHTNEKNLNRRAVKGDSVVIESIRGTSSPQSTPCVILMDKDANEKQGEVIGVNYIYSGDFQASVQVGQYQTTRVQIGMNPLTFGWRLEQGKRFVSPETVLAYSDSGLNGMSQIFHRLYRKRLCRGSWRDKERPILLNSWEAFEFDINEKNCLEMAKQAAELGIELFVVDDGWFKNRNTDCTALGDWTADVGKFPSGISGLAQQVRKLGIDFGIWFEPEMISPESDLFRAHPDWIIRSPYYEPVLSRNQYVLDLSNPEVCAYVLEAVGKVLFETGASYVKWDMNRHLTDLGSFYLAQNNQRELSHRFVLGLYHILEELNRRFPEVLFESCSSGGGRYDAGMLYYMPQTWASDNTDAVCRMSIQYGTSILFPPITMGAHVSVVPNHQVGRTTPLETRFAVAMSGNLGYEMDLRFIGEEEKKEIKRQITFYKLIRKVIQNGTFYRLKNPQEGNEAAWNFVSEDGETALLCYFCILAEPVYTGIPVQMQGLDENGVYRLEANDICFGGDELMNAGITSPRVRQDFVSYIYVFHKLQEEER